MNRLEGKVALVTAAGQGIGRAIAERFAAEGAKLIATDLDPNKLQGLRGKLRKLDVLAPDDIEAFSREIGARIRRARRSGQLRRLCAPGLGARLLRQGLGFFVQPERQIHASHDQDVPAGNAAEEGRIDRQHLIDGVFDPRRSQPLCLRRDQSRGDRADQGGRRRFHQARHSLQRRLPGHDRIAVARRAHQMRYRTTAAARSIRSGRTLSRASRWGGWGRRKKSPG